ncbi:fumarylacetoacetate hydrolase family protein [Agrococcus sp. TSP3-2-1]|uniref:fumarylacetoacetate hydrolase family protein n=1 Tax=Agrococcus sp. TSP3-2-1 TaxID=2804583 RepID=UPI003CEF5E02
MLIAGSAVHDLLPIASTVADLLERVDVLQLLEEARAASPRWHVEDLRWEGDGSGPSLLAPIDLQVVKACGVTFAGSMLERVIEERCMGDATRAADVRAELADALGTELADVKPGGPEAERVRRELLERGWWSQYLEVGIGRDPEVFTKAPLLSAVGSGGAIGIPDFSSWNNPEPELVLIVRSTGEIVGATLGNDVNLRDVEGRSALLLGKAKDNNRSTAIGPVIRLFDETFTVDDARQVEISLEVCGTDGYWLEGVNDVSALSRSFEALVEATAGRHHQYPDGFALFTGTLFAPTQDRDESGHGFTHRMGDQVQIRAEELGSLWNVVGRTEDLPPWDYGIRSLWSDLSRLRKEAHLEAR